VIFHEISNHELFKVQPAHTRMDKHQYARDTDGNWVHARDGIKGVPYFCDCPTRHPLKLVPPSGLEGKRPFSDYFAHYGGSICMSGGESMKHRLAKHRIRELASTLSFAINKCRQCGFTKNFQSNGHTVQLEVRSYDKRWRYDTVAFDQLGAAVYALEVVNTHYSSQEKIDSTRSSNYQDMGFAEFMADDVLESTNGWLHNIRTLEYPDCPRCKEIAADKQRLAIAAENERRRLAVLAELEFIETKRQIIERRLAFVEKLQKNKKKRMQHKKKLLPHHDKMKRQPRKKGKQLTPEQMIEWREYCADYLKNRTSHCSTVLERLKKIPASPKPTNGKWKYTANGWR